MKTLLLLVATLISLPAFAAESRTLFPFVDKANQDSSFVTFRNELKEIVAKKDHVELLKRVDDKISFSFGGGFGKDEFIKEWLLTGDQAKESGIWAELKTVLALGGEFSEDHEFVAPYTFNNWPENLDAYENVVVIGSNVRVRAEPNTNAKVIYVATHEVLKLVDFESNASNWMKVQTPSGKSGYVAAAYVRSPLNYRAIFKKDASGKWQMADEGVHRR